jgi:hypothetical protein
MTQQRIKSGAPLLRERELADDVAIDEPLDRQHSHGRAMFAAGLEIDLDLFRKAQTRSVTFGVITTIVPQALGTAYGLAFGYGISPAIVIGSLLASHTLISLPIVKRLGAGAESDPARAAEPRRWATEKEVGRGRR